jgi:MGT family glycosyltransferase
VTAPFVGHVNQVAGLAVELEKHGHEVAWATHRRAVEGFLPDTARTYELGEELPAQLERGMDGLPQRGLENLLGRFHRFWIPLALATLPELERAIDDFLPDVLIVDQPALSGSLAARRRELPWATSATTASPAFEQLLADFPQIRERFHDLLGPVQREAGLPPVERPDCSPHLVLVFSSQALVGDAWSPPPHYRLVGPVPAARPAVPFPWHLLAEGKRALVTLGTVNRDRGARFYASIVEAVRELRVQAIVVAPPELVPDPPENVLAVPRVPQLDLLASVDAVVCHGGHNTVCEALAAGRPLVVAPIKDDQPLIGFQVAEAGAGIQVRFGRPRPGELRAALETVLSEERYRRAAEAIRDSFREAGGAESAAEAVEALL